MNNKVIQLNNNKPTTKTAFKQMVVALGFLSILVFTILCPFATLWAMNTLFKLGIEYTFWNWLAIVILIITLQTAVNISTNKTVKLYDKTSNN